MFYDRQSYSVLDWVLLNYWKGIDALNKNIFIVLVRDSLPFYYLFPLLHHAFHQFMLADVKQVDVYIYLEAHTQGRLTISADYVPTGPESFTEKEY